MKKITEYLSKINFNQSVLQEVLVGFAIFAFTFFVIRTLRRAYIKRFVAHSKYESLHLKQAIFEVLNSTHVITVLLLSISVALSFVAVPAAYAKLAYKVLMITLILQFGIWFSILAGKLLQQSYSKRAKNDPSSATALGLVAFVMKVLIWIVALLLILDNLGINITALVAGLGIGGVAIALAVQNVLGDLLASLSIVFDKPFVVGDSISVGDFQGRIESIGIKTTRVRSISGEQVVFSNSDLLQSRIRNFKSQNERRVVFTIGVTFQTPQEKVGKIAEMLANAVKKQDKVRLDRSHFKAFGDSALIYEVVYFVLTSNFNIYMDVQEAINLEILKIFAEEKIEFAYPTRTLFINGVDEFLKVEAQNR